jgi:NAD(P)-dependent dehydrogenase (short-subunit alcohol dehydrogenase family)
MPLATGRVAGKVALVAGAASGIGRASAELLAKHGATVVCADVNATGAAEVAQAIAGSAVALDVTIEAQWEAAVAHTLASHGQLDVLVYSAGIAAARPVQETTLDEWRRVFAVNLDGAFLGTKHALRAMGQRGGSVVLISSASGLKPPPGASAYATSKAGLCMFARAVAKECAEANRNIRVNTVCPGGVKTPLWRSMPFFQELIAKTGSEEAAFQAMIGDKPGRFIEPEEVALAVLYLASDESLMVTGTDLVIDAGYSVLYTFPVRLSHLVDFLGRPLMRVRSLCRTVWK